MRCGKHVGKNPSCFYCVFKSFGPLLFIIEIDVDYHFGSGYIHITVSTLVLIYFDKILKHRFLLVFYLLFFFFLHFGTKFWDCKTAGALHGEDQETSSG